MRDQEYERVPPPHTRRLAVLGQSYVMGSGVSDGEPFEALVETTLNEEVARSTGLRYELLNFAVPNYSLAQQAIIMEDGRVGGFSPNVILLVGHYLDIRGLASYIWREVQAGRGAADPTIARWVQNVGIDKRTSEDDAIRRLHPYDAEMAQWAFGRIAAAAQRMHAQPIYAFIPMPRDRPEPEAKAILFAQARAAGFTVIDMADVYAGHSEADLSLSETDFHPNAQGHSVIAERLYTELLRIPGVIK
jgi:hypothetical protein